MSLVAREYNHHPAGVSTSKLSREQQAIRTNILGITDAPEAKTSTHMISVSGVEQGFRSIRLIQTIPSLVSIVIEKPPITVELAIDRPEVLDTVVSWHTEEWGEEWGNQVRESAGRDSVPTIFVAFEGNQPIGTSLLIKEDMQTRKDLWPWMGGIYIHPGHRSKGVAKLLVDSAVRQATSLGIPELWLYTADSRKMYEKMGWVQAFEEMYLGEMVSIMKYTLN